VLVDLLNKTLLSDRALEGACFIYAPLNHLEHYRILASNQAVPVSRDLNIRPSSRAPHSGADGGAVRRSRRAHDICLSLPDAPTFRLLIVAFQAPFNRTTDVLVESGGPTDEILMNVAFMPIDLGGVDGADPLDPFGADPRVFLHRRVTRCRRCWCPGPT